MNVSRFQKQRHLDVAPSPTPRTGLRKGVYIVPSLFTALNILAGFFSLMTTMSGFSLLERGLVAEATTRFDHAAIAIGLAVLCDTLDGRIARMTRSTSEIGIQLDSMADVVSFGMAPAMLAYAWGYGYAMRDWGNARQLAWFLSFMYVICGGFRLARFNVQAVRPRPLAEGTQKVDKKSFVGLPIPVAGCLIAAIVHFKPTPLRYLNRFEVLAILMMVLVAFLSLLMVSTIRFSSFKSVGSGRRFNPRLVIGLIALAGLIFLFSQWVLLFLAVAYIVHGLFSRGLLSIFRRSADPAR